MGRKRLEAAGPPGSAARLRVELVAADRFVSFMTWGVAAGMVLWSMLNATPYVRAHVSRGWEDTAFVLPLVVDLAFVGALRADEIASRYGISGGGWAAALRLFTGAASVFLNVGHSWERGDATGVAQHLVAPAVLVLVAEAGPAYRRRLSARLTAAEVEEAGKAAAAREREDREREERRRRDREEADRQAERDRREAERLRRQQWEDEERRLDLEERRESGRAARALDAKRLDLEEKRLPGSAAHDGMTADRNTVMTAQRHDGTRPGAAAPGPGPREEAGPAPAFAAAGPAPALVTARLADGHHGQEQRHVPPAGPVRDWDLPGLPADCAPGRAPELLTDDQSRARIRYGLARKWTQRRTGEFAGRSATTVNKMKSSLESSV